MHAEFWVDADELEARFVQDGGGKGLALGSLSGCRGRVGGLFRRWNRMECRLNAG